MRGATGGRARLTHSTFYFNPRTPCGVRRSEIAPCWSSRYFNPRTPCGVRHAVQRLMDYAVQISIHAPRAGCDNGFASTVSVMVRFQSTHPVRGATIFLHSLLCETEFQSTHPVRGATNAVRAAVHDILISIHAPRAGCDNLRRTLICLIPHFNPRTPCGVRLILLRERCGLILFQSTHPVRGATYMLRSRSLWLAYFNPRTPCGVRLYLPSRTACASRFQSTHPVRGATLP